VEDFLRWLAAEALYQAVVEQVAHDRGIRPLAAHSVGQDRLCFVELGALDLVVFVEMAPIQSVAEMGMQG
jgi:hypothetical protein